MSRERSHAQPRKGCVRRKTGLADCSREVRSFAQMMVSDHTAALAAARDTLQREGITPGENATTRTLRDNSQRAVSSLSTYSGASFDRTYMQSQVDLHQWLLNTRNARVELAAGRLSGFPTHSSQLAALSSQEYRAPES
jgi:uncharacterized protein (DUF305 family)